MAEKCGCNECGGGQQYYAVDIERAGVLTLEDINRIMRESMPQIIADLYRPSPLLTALRSRV